MYTLEDDKETTSSLRKRNAKVTSQLPETRANPSMVETPLAGVLGGDEGHAMGIFGGGSHTMGVLEGGQGHVVGALAASEGNSSNPSPSLSSQITNSFKKITTPSKVQAGSRSVALAALTMACIGVFFTAMDQTVVVTALPPIISDLNIGPAQLDHAAWIISAYLLGFIIAMPLMGRVSDIYGRRRIFLLCLSIFGIGSIFCGLAPILAGLWDISFLNAINIDTSSPGLIWLIAARFIQAIGGGAIVPVAMAIAGDFYGQERRGLALGIIGAVTEAGGVVGPLYGAIIAQQFGWQYIFYLNVPIVIVLMIAAWILIPKGTRLHEGIDWIGTILLGLALTCLSLGLAQQGTDLGPTLPNAPTPQNNPISIGLAILFLIAFVLVERKVRWPVVNLALFKRLPFSATSLVSLFVGAALIIAMADIPIFVDTVLQLPVLDSGLALLRLTAMIPLGALLGGWLCGRITCRFTAVLGLLFTAVGFYLMSRWPIHVDWTQITISTITAGFGFGLVIAPIGTTAINAVHARQAGMSSAIVTSLRMVGMMLGLAALTSWALAYFKQLASTYPSLPITATTAQFAAWSKGYAAHIISSAHTVYSAVFFTSMILCLIAIIPAIFLWGRQSVLAELEMTPASSGTAELEMTPASPGTAGLEMTLASSRTAELEMTPASSRTAELEMTPASSRTPARGVPTMDEASQQVHASMVRTPLAGVLSNAAISDAMVAPGSMGTLETEVAPVPSPDEADTVVVLPPASGSISESAASILLDPTIATEPGQPPLPPISGGGGNGWNNGRNPRKRRRRIIIAAACLLLVLLLVVAGVFAAFMWQSPDNGTSPTAILGGATATPTATPIAGPRMIQLALDQGALTSLFVSQLGLQQGALTDLKVVPTPQDGVILSLNLHIDANGIHRVMPIEMDSTIGIDKQQNIQLHVLRLKRDGLDAGPAAAASMGQAVNQMLVSSLMPSLRGQLKGVKLISVHTSTAIGCAQATEMLVLLVQAPPIQGIAAQPTPVPFCFKGPIDINQLLPH